MNSLIIVMAGSSSAFQKYDVVEVLPEGASLGTKVYLPVFLVFRIQGKSSQEISYLKDSVYSDQIDERGNHPMINLRRYFFNYDAKVPKEQLDAISSYEDGLLLIDILLSDIETK